MSYDLAVWAGPPPADDEAATQRFDELYDGEEDTAQPVSPAIEAYVASLLDKWPDLGEEADGEDESPWADGPLIGNASGDLLYFSMVWSRAEEASEFCASQARQQGLVCYDPQEGALWRYT